jgi:hypothetical protein
MHVGHSICVLLERIMDSIHGNIRVLYVTV